VADKGDELGRCSKAEQQRAKQSVCGEGLWTVVGPSLEGQAAAQKEMSSLASHTLKVKMYFREPCKIICTVLIICSILSCRNHCDMSSIK